MAHLIAKNFRDADLSPVDRALCEHAEKITRDPAAMAETDVHALRAVGLDDRAILDATLVMAMFAFFTRMAEGLGATLEPQWRDEWGEWP